MGIGNRQLLIIAVTFALLLCSVFLMFVRLRRMRMEESKNKMIRKIVDGLAVGAFAIENDRFIYVNEQFCTLTGYKADMLKRMKWQDMVSLENYDRSPTVIRELREGRRQSFAKPLIVIRGDGARTPLHVCVKKIADIKHPWLFFGTATLEKSASVDADYGREGYMIHPVTGLPGRTALKKQLDREMVDHPERPLALAFVDIDSMKRVNDTMGREAGDKLLVEAATRLKACEGERVYHYSDDGFAVLFEGRTRADVKLHMSRLMHVFTAPIQIKGTLWYETATIGVSMFPEDGGESGTLIDRAVAAVHHAKKNNRGKYEFYNPGMMDSLRKRLELEMDLRHAVTRHEFMLHYQPQVDLNAGTVVGCEALIRWIHPTRGLISPGLFIPLAEELGLIEGIGEWVLHTACRQAKKWNDQGYALRVSVNLSPRQLFQERLIDMVRLALAESGLAPGFLQLEITETAGADLFLMTQKLRDLEALGVGISIDDFGTGYNSLNYLRQLPLNQLKIDPAFIRNDSDRQDVALVRMIVALAGELNLQVVAEGVETAEHVAFLKQTHCALAQGYLFARPLPADRFIDQLGSIKRHINHLLAEQVKGI